MKSAAQKDGRGNIAPATIILPTLAMEAKKKAEHNQTEVTDEFMKILDKAIDDCVGELVERFNWICAQNPASARFMYENATMAGYHENEGIRSALKHGTLVVGQLGLAECLQILFCCDQTEKRGMDFAKKIEQLYKDKCNAAKEKYYFVDISKDQIVTEMINNIEKDQNRKLSNEEINEIIDFCNNKNN